MNSNNDLFTLIQQGFRITVGATASLVETIQDPAKRSATLSQLQTELQQRTTEWAQKGETTEQEARRMIDELLKQQASSTPEGRTTTSVQNYPTATTKTSTEVELKELTAQVVSLRTELEQLRQSQD
ncbi:MAG: hypothetical protein DSM107014_03710 [Gomphosphaeria aponina SAG 52.96 = DSM 107014]|uniref:Uncharacterized protein n=1 Tax=Gomphosphaeria aponina SAG 52.96 = DSM 107014 TaxID=1521640 RepID=A0A941JRJ2_9CHRO|nr:hypothetical protein [Gomphosphaeria aponina SAG 52.96 = DSM 107014]